MLAAAAQSLRPLGAVRPTVVVDEDRARANIRAMAAKARRAGVRFRPHFKTHQSPAVARWFADEGVTGATVSSVAMAEACLEWGWRDLTVALLLNPGELPRLCELAQRAAPDGALGVLVDDPGTAALAAGSLPAGCPVWIKVDTGYGRTGLRWDDTAAAAAVLEALDPRPAAGLLTHAGHAYGLRGRDALCALRRETNARLAALREALGRPGLLLSSGDTPCCGADDDLGGVDEVRPGNFVFNDLMQLRIGSCAEADLAAAVVCPVLGLYPERGELVLHGGAVHLAKESLATDGGGLVHGLLGTASGGPEGPRPGRVLHEAPIVSLSQEHGVVRLGDRYSELADGLVPGDPLLVWPVHSCLTCDLHDHYLTFGGERLPRL